MSDVLTLVAFLSVVNVPVVFILFSFLFKFFRYFLEEITDREVLRAGLLALTAFDA